MKYRLEISINTEGDFYFPYVPCGMTCDEENYRFQKEYRDRETAIQATRDICQFLKKHLMTSKDYVKKEMEKFISTFEARLEGSEESDDECVSDYLSGNYDWTEFCFKALPRCCKVSFKVTDEEAYQIQNSLGRLKEEDIKKAVLDLCEKVEK